jgi:hypothetical protein
LKNRYVVLFALILGISIYHFWFFNKGILVQGDWNYYTHITQSQLLRLLPGWTSNGLGQVNASASFYPLDLLWGSSSHLFNFAVSERLIFMFPSVIVAILGSYGFLYELFKNKTAALLASLLFCYNGYFMILRTGDLTIAVATAFSPLILYVYLLLLNQKRNYLVIIIAILSFIQSFFDFRIFLITALIVAAILIFHMVFEHRSDKLKVSILTVKALAVFMLLSLYWIIGLAKTGEIASNSAFDNSLFGSQYYNIFHALSFTHPFWSIKGPTIFTAQPVALYFWIIPVLAILGLYFYRNNWKVILFSGIALVGVLLTKQSGVPFSQLYEWLFEHVPGFNAFREASKFYTFTAVGYSVLVAALLSYLHNSVSKPMLLLRYCSILALSFIFLINVSPLFDGKGSSLYVDRHMPADYSLTNKFFNSQKGFFRTAWVPQTSWWNTYTLQQPMIDVGSTLSGTWQTVLENPQPSLSVTSYNQIVDDLEKPYAQNVFDLSSVRYVVIPLRDSGNDEDFFKNTDRQFFIDSLDDIKWLKRINIGTKNVIVYAVKGTKPYFSASTKIQHLPVSANLANSYNFVSGTLKQGFNYTDSNFASDTSSIVDPFNNIGPNNIKNRELGPFVLRNSRNDSLYVREANNTYSYQVNNNILKINKSQMSQIVLNKLALKKVGSSGTVATYDLNSTNMYYLNYADNIYPVNIKNKSVRKLGLSNNSLSLLVPSSQNLINNPSFNKGLWQETVNDCNDYDNSPRISMELVRDKILNKKVLQLTAINHSACTGPAPIKVAPGQKILLQFSYRVVQGKETGYQLTFNNKQATTLIKYLPVADSSWRTYRGIVTVPSGATSLKLIVMATPNQDTPTANITNYTNFSATRVGTLVSVPADDSNNYKIYKLNSNTNTISVDDSSINGKNLVDNPSLENGLWESKVGDCDDYDNKPIIGMLLSDDHTTGKHSLELYAERHIACTGPPAIDVSESSTYNFQFDYKSTTNSNSGYEIAFNDPNHTIYKNTGLPSDNKWSTFNSTVSAPYGATQARITFFSAADPSANIVKSVNLYDSISFNEIPNVSGNAYLVKSDNQVMSKPKSINYTINSSTEKNAYINGATKPFYLEMSEAYNPGWSLKAINASSSVNISNHVKVDDFANAWLINPMQICNRSDICIRNPDGSYNIKLEAFFSPQKYFNIGLVISSITLISCSMYLTYEAYVFYPEWNFNKKQNNILSKDKKR